VVVFNASSSPMKLIGLCTAVKFLLRLPPFDRSLGHPNRNQNLMAFDIIVIQPLVALIAGILILIVPRLLNYVVAIYLIVIGIIGLWPRLFYH
jgi:hypothetical protein